MKIFSKSSLRLRLIWVLSVSALVIWSVATVTAWFQAKHEINKMFDAQQILFAKRLSTSDLSALIMERKIRGGFREHHKRKGSYDDDALAFAIFTHDGELIAGDDAKGNNIIFAPEHGFSKATPRGEDEPWRIFWLPSYNGELMIAVGQEIDYREDIVEDIILSQMWVWIAGLPLLIGLMVFLVNLQLKTLQRVSNEMRNRSPESQELLSTENLPTESLPLVNGLNGFFKRTSAMLQRERRFTSDAAHELRSPLAGLRIQAELAQMLADDTKLRDEALQNLTKGIDRATQVIEQLLTLSRLDNLQQLDDLEMISWSELISSVIAEQYFHAQKRKITLNFEQTGEPEPKQGQSVLLSLMLRNVIDNGIKYCPEGAQINVRLENQKIIVQDNGGGVTEEDLAKLGQRFYRPAGQNEKGSGLGLSIVFRIAELHHINVRLENAENLQGERGLCVSFEL